METKLSVIPFLIFSILISSCNNASVEKYHDQVGDIIFDEKIDESKLSLCNENRILQYYNFSKGIQFEGEKIAITRYFNEKYNVKPMAGESGYIVIRFIVNCKGQSGRFRVLEMDDNLEPRKFDNKIKDQLLNLTVNLKGWKIGLLENQPHDYYQYLNFKIDNGLIKEIMP